MRYHFRVVLCLAVLFVGAVALAQSRWDGTYTRTCSLIMDGGNQRCTVHPGAYVMVDCAKDTNIGLSLADAGAGLYSCLLADAGQTCALYHYTLGERFYGQAVPKFDSVTTYNAGTDTCGVFEGR